MDPEIRFREVFELAYAPLCRYARHRGLTGPDAEDLVAQTMETAWRRIGEMPATEPLPWLYAVAWDGLGLRAMLETCGSAGEGCTFPVIE